MSNLKPCRFCGGTGIVHVSYRDGDYDELCGCKAGNTEKEEYKMSNKQEHLKKVQQLVMKYNEKKEFAPGDIVVLNENFALWKFPTKQNPGVVVEVLQEPVYDRADSGSPYFAEPRDILVAEYAATGGRKPCLCLYCINSKRLEHYNPEQDD